MRALKKTLLVLTVLFAIVTMASCFGAYDAGDDHTKEKYTVTFNYGDGRENEKLTVHSGETVTLKLPERDGYEFVGWCTNKELTNFVDLESSITGDVTLYAKWSIDYKSLLDRVSSEASEKCVKIVSRDGMYSSSQGSGVIYKNDSFYCYVLTNSHVVTGDSGKVNQYNKVYDVYGEEYTATVIKNDPSCDLAVLRFRGVDSWTLENLEILEIDERIPNKNDEVLTVSAPNGKYNTVTLGNVVWYGVVESSTTIDFEVLWIETEVDHGSSGGVVLDSDMNIIGIIFAMLDDEESGKKCVLAIPAPRIVEFLSDIEY